MNDLCIYNEKHECILDKITITATGACDDCMMTDFPEDIVNLHKKRLRAGYLIESENRA